MKAYYELQKLESRECFFLLKSPKGEAILFSDAYMNRSSCLKGLESCREHSPFDRFYTRIDETGHSFSLRASNNRIIAQGSEHDTADNREAVILAVKKYAPTAQIIDHTNEG